MTIDNEQSEHETVISDNDTPPDNTETETSDKTPEDIERINEEFVKESYPLPFETISQLKKPFKSSFLGSFIF